MGGGEDDLEFYNDRLDEKGDPAALSGQSNGKHQSSKLLKIRDYLAATWPLLGFTFLVIVANLIFNEREIASQPKGVYYHNIGTGKVIVDGGIMLIVLLIPALHLPGRPSWPSIVSLGLIAGSGAANGISMFIWRGGVPDYFHLSSLFFFHPARPVVANSADLCLSLGIPVALLATIAFAIRSAND